MKLSTSRQSGLARIGGALPCGRGSNAPKSFKNFTHNYPAFFILN